MGFLYAESPWEKQADVWTINIIFSIDFPLCCVEFVFVMNICPPAGLAFFLFAGDRYRTSWQKSLETLLWSDKRSEKKTTKASVFEKLNLCRENGTEESCLPFIHSVSVEYLWDENLSKKKSPQQSVFCLFLIYAEILCKQNRSCQLSTFPSPACRTSTITSLIQKWQANICLPACHAVGDLEKIE